MKIAHVAPFAPNRCGLYESARDMARSDIFGGNDVYFVDAGITSNGKKEEPKIGAVDDRGNFRLVTADCNVLDDADIIIMHTGLEDNKIVRNQTPLLWVVHGRPLACFRPERMGINYAYTLYQNVAQWKRTKGMLYFWKEHKPYWKGLFNGKDIVLDYPVIDETRFKPLPNNNIDDDNFHFLICDSEREDIDNFELVNGLIYTAKHVKNLKFHFYGMDTIEGKLPNCWNLLLNQLKELNALGEVVGRVGDMEKVYNKMDCLISPNKIITRTIGEALSCGIPVISATNTFNMVSDITCDMGNVEEIKKAIETLVFNYRNGKIDKNEIINRSHVFSLESNSLVMNMIYKKILEGD